MLQYFAAVVVAGDINVRLSELYRVCVLRVA